MKHRITRAGVAVAGLSDRADVDDGLLPAEFVYPAQVARPQEIRVFGNNALNVRVADDVFSVQNIATIDADLNNDGDLDDEGEQVVATAQSEWVSDPVLTPTQLPSTGFAPDKETILPVQLDEFAYTNMGDFWLDIPVLNVKIPIVGVPRAADSWNVDWLGAQAGWLEGTAYPTWNGNSVITGHVYLADGTPGSFSELKTLQYGDQIKIQAWGQTYTYEVRESKRVSTANIKGALQHEELDWLTLVTCEEYQMFWQTYAARRVVRAVLVSVK